MVISLQFVAGILTQRAFSKRKTAMVTSLFGKYVSPGVVDELLKGDIDTNLEGRRENLTVLFSDLRSFTTLSEALGARDTSRLLNVYFDAMIPLVFKYGGTLDKLIGDAVMAFFGAPVRLGDHPEQAARSALDMLSSLTRLKRESSLPGVESLEIGIGLNSGIATVGNLGSHHFMDYTIIGDTVNLASRLEGLNKYYGTRLLISEFCAGGLGEEFLVRTLDCVRVKGKETPVTICELRGYRDLSDTRELEALSLFEEGLRCYRHRHWQQAHGHFDSVLALWPDDRPAALYIDRIDRLQATPPGDDWEAVETFTTK